MSSLGSGPTRGGLTLGIALLLAAACGDDAPSGCDPEEASEQCVLDRIPSDCEFLGERGEERCVGNQEACEQARNDAGHHQYLLLLVEGNDERFYTLEEMTERAECFASWLEALGLDARTNLTEGGNGVSTRVTVDGTTALLQPIVESAAVSAYGVTCAGGACRYCFDLDETSCIEDAFCYADMGRPVDKERRCVEPRRFARCLSDGGCDDAGSLASSDDGECWEFDSICYAPDLSYSHDACGADLSFGMPPCE